MGLGCRAGMWGWCVVLGCRAGVWAGVWGWGVETDEGNDVTAALGPPKHKHTHIQSYSRIHI